MFARMFMPIVAIASMLAVLPAQAGISVTISPNYAQIVPGQTLQFSATVTGGSNAVTWQVNNANGGNGTGGTVSSSGLYAPPQTIPDPAVATITAVSQADPSVSATATVTLMTQLPTGTTFYVATNGNDSNPGTQAEPWLTIQHAAKSVKAGDTVLVRGGVYNEYISFPNSGTSTNYITFASYPGELATIDGTGLKIPGGQWGLFTFQNASDIVTEGFELRNYTTKSLSNVPIGIYVLGAGSGLQIVNNQIHNIETLAQTNPSQCGSNAFGLTVYGTKAPQAIDGIAISGNAVYANKTGCSETLSLDGNVTNFAVVSNSVHDDDNIAIDAIGFEHVSPNVKYDQARMGEIRGNTIYNITSYGNPDYGKQYAADGIYVDGGTEITIEQNLIHNADLPIELASEHLGHVTSFVTARNNVIYSGNSTGISIGGYGAKRGGTDHCTIVGNTLYGDDSKHTGSGEFQIQWHATNNVFENNIAYATKQGLMINDYTSSEPAPSVIDYNLWYSLIGAGKAKYVWQGSLITGYSNYLSKTGNDAHSPPFSDPQFVGLGSPPDLDIQPASPAINAGIVLDPGIIGAVDFLGNPRTKNGTVDIGAYEQ